MKINEKVVEGLVSGVVGKFLKMNPRPHERCYWDRSRERLAEALRDLFNYRSEEHGKSNATRVGPLHCSRRIKLFPYSLQTSRESEIEIVIVEMNVEERSRDITKRNSDVIFVKEVQFAYYMENDLHIHRQKIYQQCHHGLHHEAPERADSRDVLTKHWEELPHEARIATGSIRRKQHY